jgi:salicylate biosynthesis isochorismate synthase/menaquinone-specific isochorismate synthase
LRSDKDREEQAIVVRGISRAPAPARGVGRRRRTSPALIKVANIQHLATPIRAQLTNPLSAIELAGLLHPTPAVGGEPHALAAPQIPVLEGLDRGWYAGAVGWTDANDDGEFCVALRCALLRGTRPACTRASASCATPTRRPSCRDRDQARRAAPGPRRLGIHRRVVRAAGRGREVRG